MGTDKEYREEEAMWPRTKADFDIAMPMYRGAGPEYARAPQSAQAPVVPNSGPTPTSADDRSRDTYAPTWPEVNELLERARDAIWPPIAHESAHDDA